jgi:hypothetical protein
MRDTARARPQPSSRPTPHPREAVDRALVWLAEVVPELPGLLESDWLPELDMFDSPERLAQEDDARQFGSFMCME